MLELIWDSIVDLVLPFGLEAQINFIINIFD